MKSRSYLDIVISQTSFDESKDLSIDDIYVCGILVEKKSPSVCDYFTDDTKDLITKTFGNTSDLKLTTNTEIL